MLRVLFCGGGSLGHLLPSLAVWEALGERPGARALFVCSPRRDERRSLQARGLPFRCIHAPRGSRLPLLLLFPFQFLLACSEALWILLTFQPQVVFCKGGYVSPPVGLVAWLLRIPIVLHESDRLLGRANRFLLRFARYLCLGFPQQDLEQGGVVLHRALPVSVTGNPVRRALLHGSRDRGRGITGFSGRRPVLLVLGGSQGAQVLNMAVQESLQALLELCDVIHLTGRGKDQDLPQHARYFVRSFEDQELPHLLALADLVVSRAGAGTIAELSVLGKATILVPLPDLAHAHQEENAHFLELAGAAVVLPQTQLRDGFLPTVHALLADQERRRELSARFQSIASPDAAQRITRILLELARS